MAISAPTDHADVAACGGAALLALRARARELQDAGEWTAEALAVNDAILEADPSSEPAAVRRARCLRALGRLDAAAQGLAELVARSPRNTVAVSQLVAVRRRIDARRRAEALLRVSKAHLVVEVERAKAEERDTTFQVEGRRLLARRERTPGSACALAAAQRRDRDLDGALNTYRWALAQHPSPRPRALAQTGLAAVLRELGRLRDAELLLRKVVDADPSDGHAWLALVGVLLDRYEKHDEEEVISEAEAVMKHLKTLDIRDPPMAAACARLRRLGDRPWR